MKSSFTNVELPQKEDNHPVNTLHSSKVAVIIQVKHHLVILQLNQYVMMEERSKRKRKERKNFRNLLVIMNFYTMVSMYI